MPVLVFWRFNFGYAFLSPKSIFLSCIFASCLASYIVFHEAALTPVYGSTARFLLAAGGLYLVHFTIGVVSETRQRGKHDQYSGSSWLVHVLKPAVRGEFEGICQTTVEPFLTLVVATFFHAKPLGKVLVVCAAALALKELIRIWLDLRRKKRMQDSIDDAKDSMELSSPTSAKPVSATGRTAREKFDPNKEQG
ncbi:MAG: hypothetical protein ABIS50_03725 [Luteolibacter sp.]|uniref:hypothetical protein n=1 Tax=Luteolibacter sp. TaxID=1962973 RepID=UPI0032672C23